MESFELSDPKPEKRNGLKCVLLALVIYLVLLSAGAGLLVTKVLNLQERLRALEIHLGNGTLADEDSPSFALLWSERAPHPAAGALSLQVLRAQLSQVHTKQERLLQQVDNFTRNPGFSRTSGTPKDLWVWSSQMQSTTYNQTPGSFQGLVPGKCPELFRVKGERGTPGPPGLQGPPGIKGEAGLQGPKGAPGKPGDTGNPGPQGEKGSKGDGGLAGQQGATGAKGDKGDQGLPGSKGDMGMKGDTGIMGPPGAQGSKGDSGEPGPPGVAGVSGIKGDRGSPGAEGLRGPQGAAGPPGAKGEPGRAGTAGLTGPPGRPGNPGAEGVKGSKGDTGLQGQKGTKGESGVPGPAGVKGDKGSPGLAGPKGASGPSGQKGDPGMKGSPGSQGAKGEKGQKGEPRLPVRIIGSANRGRAEIYYSNSWGTICDDGWDNSDATVFCRMLGYSVGKAIYQVGAGTGPIWLDDVGCQGTESSLWDCRKSQWGSHNCNHSEDAGVECS